MEKAEWDERKRYKLPDDNTHRRKKEGKAFFLFLSKYAAQGQKQKVEKKARYSLLLE